MLPHDGFRYFNLIALISAAGTREIEKANQKFEFLIE
jgi:hypothetical protein